jgi:hypothetical protein
LQSFWEQEVVVSPIRTKEEVAVERHFVGTTTRTETGCFVVRVPGYLQNLQLEDTYSTAKYMFHQLEGKLTRNFEL